MTDNRATPATLPSKEMPNVTGEHSTLLREMERRAASEARSYRRYFPDRADQWERECQLCGEAASFIDWCINEGVPAPTLLASSSDAELLNELAVAEDVRGHTDTAENLRRIAATLRAPEVTDEEWDSCTCGHTRAVHSAGGCEAEQDGFFSKGCPCAAFVPAEKGSTAPKSTPTGRDAPIGDNNG